MLAEQFKIDEEKYKNEIFDLKNTIKYHERKENNNNQKISNNEDYLQKHKNVENDYNIKKYYNKIIEEQKENESILKNEINGLELEIIENNKKYK